jgi:hypothetical protein
MASRRRDELLRMARVGQSRGFAYVRWACQRSQIDAPSIENTCSDPRVRKFRVGEERPKAEIAAAARETEGRRRERAVLLTDAPPEPPKMIFARLRGLLGR